MMEFILSLNPVLMFFLGLPLLWWVKQNLDEDQNPSLKDRYRGYTRFIAYTVTTMMISSALSWGIFRHFLMPGSLEWAGLKTDFRFLSALIFFLILKGVMAILNALCRRYLKSVSSELLLFFSDSLCQIKIGQTPHAFRPCDQITGAYLGLLCLVVYRSNSFFSLFQASIGACIGWSLGLWMIVAISFFTKNKASISQLSEFWTSLFFLGITGLLCCAIWGIRFI